jgi:hypothetical protein
MDAIKAAQERASELMKQTKFADDASYASAAAAMEREMARYRTAVRHRNRRGLPTSEQSSLPHDENPA